MPINLRGPILAGLLIAGAGNGSARAQQIDIAAAMNNAAVKAAVDACMADHGRLCSTVMPGGGRIVKCLAAKVDQLAPECRAAMVHARGVLIDAGIVPPGALAR